jgi:6-phosphogluconolactonase (cycloisomerase 2 family)
VVANGTGTAGTTNVTNIAVTCTTNPPRFLYVANRGSNDVSGYTIDPVAGALTAIAGSPFAAGGNPVAIAVDPTGAYVFVVNQLSATVSRGHRVVVDLGPGDQENLGFNAPHGTAHYRSALTT